MSEELASLPWTEEQWVMVRRVVQESARKARVASSFLPLYGPLPESQVTVPALPLTNARLEKGQRGEPPNRLEVDDGMTVRLTTIACDIYVKTHEAKDPELASVVQMLGRAASVLGRLEDAIVFNGQPAADRAPQRDRKPVVTPEIYTVHGGERRPGLLDTDLKPIHVTGSRDEQGENLVEKMVEAIQTLEGAGHYGPFAAVLGNELYAAANRPSSHSLVLPSDRILPFLDGPLLRSSTIPDDQGVVLAQAGSPVDLVVARDMHVRFLQLSAEPRYVLRLSERFTLRIKQGGAVVRLVAGNTKKEG